MSFCAAFCNLARTWDGVRDIERALCVAFDHVDGRVHGPCTVVATVASDSAATGTAVDNATVADSVAIVCTAALVDSTGPGELHSRRRIGDGA